MNKQTEIGYNERLFKGCIRKKLHMARYYWITKSLLKLDCEFQSCLELGCFDGKVIDFLPTKPVRYLGLDANWEGGAGLGEREMAKRDSIRIQAM